MSNYIQIYNDALNVSKKRIVRELKLFNEKYCPIIKSIHNKIDNKKYDFLPELISLNFAPWIGKMYSYYTHKGKIYDHLVSDFMAFSTFLVSKVPLAMHILNKSFEKINFDYSFYVKDSESDPENMKKIMGSDLESRCKNYLITLPNTITLENVDSIDLIAEQNHIPKTSENPIQDITTRLKKLS
jgi:hypothetical protein